MDMYDSPVKTLQALGFALILLLLLPTFLQSYAIYQICSPVRFSCGERAIDSVVAPFRTDEQPEKCGMESFRLFCHGEYPAIRINSAVYWVRDINYQTRILTLVSMDFVGTLCPSGFTTTALDISPFSFNFDVLQVPIRYDCSCGDDSGIYFWSLPCPANSPFSCAYLAVEAFILHPYWGCRCPGPEVRVALRRPEFEDLVGRRWINASSFMEVLLHGFKVRWPDAYTGTGWCAACRNSGGNCTYDAKWPSGSCLCQGVTYSPVCPSLGPARWWTSKRKVVIGTTLGIGGFSLMLCLLFYLRLHFDLNKMSHGQDIQTRKKLKQTQYIQAFLERYGSIVPKRYSYSELEKMTNSFDNTIGKGGFATVYKGKLLDGRSVAVKVLGCNSRSSGKVFVNELVSICSTYHVNIVSLLGYCLEGSVRALIYEYMPNGSLEKFIFGDKRGTLGWDKLYDIAVGIARGLEYLHRGCHMSILHFDIKPHNILLDHNFCPKISDFGLAQLCRLENDDPMTSCAGGTVGYIAPEVISLRYRSVSSKADVYSYGMMILEMVGGRKNFEPQVDNTSKIYYPYWMYKHLDLDGNFQVCGELTEDEAVIARRMITVGLWCIQMDPADRPSINQVVAMLEGRIDLHMPSKPVLYNTVSCTVGTTLVSDATSHVMTTLERVNFVLQRQE